MNLSRDKSFAFVPHGIVAVVALIPRRRLALLPRVLGASLGSLDLLVLLLLRRADLHPTLVRGGRVRLPVGRRASKE